MKKIILTLILGIFFISLASATVQNLGVFKIDECINLVQVGADFNSCNISSVLAPNSTQVLGEVLMTKNNNNYNYTYCQPDTVGQYIVTGFCEDGNISVWAYNFDITPTGEELTDAKSFSYIGLIFFLFCISLISLISIFRLQNFMGKFIMFWVTYLLFFALTFISYQVTDSYFVNVEFLGNFLWILFWIMLIAIVPLVFGSMAFVFYTITYNDHFKKLVEKGMTPEEAFKSTDKKLNPFRRSKR